MRALLYVFTVLMVLSFSSSYVMAAPIMVDKQAITIQAKELQQRPLLTQAVELQGPSSSRDFYYTLKEDVQTEGHTVTFQIQHSELLIAPSSFTVKVDDAAVKTVALTSDMLKQSVTVTLTGEALQKGIHKITANFYGVLKEGVCVAPGNAGSWLRIDILSSMSVFNASAQEWTLAHYPTAFLSYEESIATMILPDQATEATLNSSYQLAAYLSEQGEQDIKIVRESALERVTGPVIVVGAKDEFGTDYMKKMLENANVQYEEALSLAIHVLKNDDKNQSVPALFVTATSSDALQERISLLTDARLYEQLVGSTLTVPTLPKVDKLSTTTIPLTQLGFDNKTLSSQMSVTPHYYVALPQLEADKEVMLRLLLKKSATLPKKGDDKDREVELIVHVNGVPHAVDLRTLEVTSTDLYEAIIPIQTSVLNKKTMTDIQFEVTGFQLEDPCETTNERYWLYIDGSSTLSVVGEATTPTFTLRDFPSAFHERSLIIVPDEATSNDGQMLLLYKALMMNGLMANTTYKKDKDVTEDDLKQHATIFSGLASDFKILANEQEKIPQSAEAYLQQGFLEETIAHTAFMTKSFWQEKQPFLLLQTLDSAFAQKDFLAHLKGTNEKTTAAIETKEGRFIVATGGTESSVQEVTTKGGSISFMLIAEFALLVLAIGLILYFILRKKRKNKLEDEV